ncbi:HD-GYP domain-containing protein [Methylomagnum sp.]
MHVRLFDMVLALSDALDLVGVDSFMHGKRVGVMAAKCAEYLGLDRAAQARLLRAGLLHDCGVSSTVVHQKLLTDMAWAGTHEHCLLGQALLESFPPLADLAPIVRHHHTPWDQLPADLDENLRRDANLIFLADRADALTVPYYEHPEFLYLTGGTRFEIEGQAGSAFQPELVLAFLEASESESFWLSLEPSAMWPHLHAMGTDLAMVEMDTASLYKLAVVFSKIVDAKSPFTVEHSLNVSRISRYLAEQSGLDEETRDKVEIAGLLHDIGKLRVPDEILNKPGRLDSSERAAIMRHSFETYQILHRIAGLEEIALWAAYHHEKLNGGGYPFHSHDGEIPYPARIIAVADIYQALAQRRPYRPPLDPATALSYLKELAESGHLEPTVVDLVDKNAEACWRIANGQG